MTRPFRFAVTVGGASSRADLFEVVRRAEDAGFDVIAGVDHIGPPLGVLPMLAAVAQVTDLRLTTMVAANDYRHPVQLARDAATVDVVSDGRFELGIGTGWIREQYEAAGYPYRSAGERVDRLREAVAVIKGCWASEPFSSRGSHYQVNLTGHPAPVQRPRPPILIAGSGPRMLRLAGKEADIVGITVTSGLEGFGSFGEAVAHSGEHIESQRAWIAGGAGSRFGDIELSVMLHRYVADDREAEAVAQETGVDSADLARSPHVAVGPAERVIDELIEQRERLGISYIVFRGTDLAVAAPIVSVLAGR